jgi:PAS domain S-box-containing protein
MEAGNAHPPTTSFSANFLREAVRPRWQYLALFFAAYVSFCGFAKWVAILPDTGISIWPPAGLFVATLILAAERHWPWWALAALAAELVANALWFRNPVVVALLLNAGNALCAVAGAWLVKRYGQGPIRLESLRDVLGLVVLGAVVAPVIAATVGAATLVWAEGQPFAKAWTLWWIGDATGVLLVAPLLLVGLQSWEERARLSLARLAEAALLALLLIAAAALGLGGRLLPFAFVIPPLLWAAIRFEFRGAVVALVLLTLTSAALTGSGVSLFSAMGGTASARDRQMMLMLFIASSAVLGLVVAAMARQNRLALQALRTANEGLEDNVASRTADLHRSEQRFRALADSLPVIVWVTDAQGAIEFVNPEYERFFGMREDESRASGWQPLLHPDDAPAYVEAFLAAQHERLAFQATARVRRADGAWRYVASRGVPRLGSAGEFVGMVGSSPDITDRIEREQTLADEGRRKDEFLAMLAHELRNPLAPIRNAAQLLALNPTQDPRVARASGVIERQSAHLARLVDDLLDVSRVTTGKVLLRPATHDAVGIVQAGVESARPMADAKGQQLALHLPAPGTLFVNGDAARLTQVVGNVVGNAAKYGGEGAHIEVLLRAAESTPDALEIVVTDDGPGIDPAVLPHVFNLFVQGETSIARDSGGLGVGLAIVRKLVELHGGSVSAHSDGPGRGARFVIRLPKVAPPVARTGPAAGPAPHATAARRVLIVDDNADAADSLAMLLQLEGHDVTVCHDSRSGLAQARARAFDAVLLDLGLPGLDGFQVARALRAEGASRGARLIAVTGYGQPEDRARTASAGFDAHCIKPVDSATLNEMLQAPEANFETLLARQIDDSRLLRLLDAWRSLRERKRLPEISALLAASAALEPWRAVAVVESLSPEFAIRVTAAGRQLAGMLDSRLIGRRLSQADPQWGSLEAAYLAVALRGEPGLDSAELRFGAHDVLRFKRLIVPAGDADGTTLTHLVAVVLLEDTVPSVNAFTPDS